MATGLTWTTLQRVIGTNHTSHTGGTSRASRPQETLTCHQAHLLHSSHCGHRLAVTNNGLLLLTNTHLSGLPLGLHLGYPRFHGAFLAESLLSTYGQNSSHVQQLDTVSTHFPNRHAKCGAEDKRYNGGLSTLLGELYLQPCSRGDHNTRRTAHILHRPRLSAHSVAVQHIALSHNIFRPLGAFTLSRLREQRNPTDNIFNGEKHTDAPLSYSSAPIPPFFSQGKQAPILEQPRRRFGTKQYFRDTSPQEGVFTILRRLIPNYSSRVYTSHKALAGHPSIRNTPISGAETTQTVTISKATHNTIYRGGTSETLHIWPARPYSIGKNSSHTTKRIARADHQYTNQHAPRNSYFL